MTGITIQLKRNGPYVISAEEAPLIEILDADGQRVVPEPGRAIALCRCGASATKPFCDKSHRRNGFVGTGHVAAEPLRPPRPGATSA